MPNRIAAPTSTMARRSPDEFSLEGAVDYLMDPVSANVQGRHVMSLHVGDLVMAGDDAFEKQTMAKIRKDFQVRG